MKRASHRDFQKLKSLMALRFPARELSSSALHKADAIAAALAIILDAAKMRLDGDGAVRLS
jgi:hypothetical protein